MKKYNVPSSLIDDYLAIKTNLSKLYATYYLAGNTSTAAYRLACKELKRKPAKHPKESAHQIYTNIHVFSFITKAKEILSIKAIEGMCFSHQNRLETTQKVIDYGLEMMASGKKQSGTDIIKAIEVQNSMLGKTDRLEGMDDDEKRKQAVIAAKHIIELYDNE